MKLINLTETLKDVCERGHEFFISSVDIDNVKKILTDQEVINIVQCKDCKYFRFDGFDYVCEYHLKPLKVDKDDYCSNANKERKVKFK